MKKIDIATWERKKPYLWFSSFSNPTYSLTVRMDVTNLIALKEEYGRSFYEDMLYLAVKGLNAVPAMRLRVEKDEIIEYDCADPSFTVAMDGGLFDVCRVDWNDDPEIFCKTVRAGIENTKKHGGNKPFGDTALDVYYFSCLPWVDFTEMSNPIPDDAESYSIPRICWGKFVKCGEKYELGFNITVSHALVDGRQLCDAFRIIAENIKNCKELLLRQ